MYIYIYIYTHTCCLHCVYVGVVIYLNQACTGCRPPDSFCPEHWYARYGNPV